MGNAKSNGQNRENDRQNMEAVSDSEVKSESDSHLKSRDEKIERGPVSLNNDDLSQHSPKSINGAAGEKGAGYLNKFSKKKDYSKPKPKERPSDADRFDDISDLTSIPQAVYENDKNRNNNRHRNHSMNSSPNGYNKTQQLREEPVPVSLPRIPSREGPVEQQQSHRTPSAPLSGRYSEPKERTTSAPPRLDDDDILAEGNDEDFFEFPDV